jgi:hypothetical protein
MSACVKPLVTITAEVPYATLLRGWLHIHMLDFIHFVERSRRYERPFSRMGNGA